MSGVIIRRAKEADYEGVISVIPNLYDGMDYIPSCYHDMIRDPRRLLIVAEVDTLIVGFTMFYIVDEDGCGVAEALRIKNEHRMNHLSIKMMQYAFSIIHKQRSSVKALAIVSRNEQEMYKLQFEPSLEKFFYRNVVMIRTNDDTLLTDSVSSPEFHLLCNKLPVQQTKPVTPSVAVQILDNIANNQNILTDYCWLVNFEPFKPIHTNHMIFTHSNTKGVPLIMVTKGVDDDVTAVSFSTTRHVNKGWYYCLDFYCHKAMRDLDAGKLLLLGHILKHLILFNQLKISGMHIMEVLVPKEMDRQKVKECFCEVGIKGYTVEDKCQREYCAETNLGYITRHKL